MDKSTQSELLDAIADYADVVSGATESEQSKSMATAFALDTLYEQGDWVDEWLEEAPKPRSVNSDWTPANKSRFTKWVEWRENSRSRSTPSTSHMRKLMEAAHSANDIGVPPGKTPSEKTFRPLTWLYSNGREANIKEVWAIAVESAGSVDDVTATYTKAALAEWKNLNLGNRSSGQSQSSVDKRTRIVDRWRRDRQEIARMFVSLADDAAKDDVARDELVALWDELLDIMDLTESRIKERVA